jgi:hypothetical protein
MHLKHEHPIQKILVQPPKMSEGKQSKRMLYVGKCAGNLHHSLESTAYRVVSSAAEPN